MNATVCRITDLELDVCNHAATIDDDYGTAPMITVLPKQQPIDEEELLHSCFEEALNDRITGSHNNWHHLSDGSLNSIQRVPVNYATDEIVAVTPGTKPLTMTDSSDTVLISGRHHNLIFVCLALTLILIGFDIMGLLVLSMR
ncbi:hypothetical protein KDA_23280 [Dictyobacter alpinus]|uniref:Uncharacterized protein n=1 Tax=Dictyobacter alpinus TaxID=2014873 RepID=A0A402B672_9CHLR|nr:hypothetical protein [Dictyobacter alpinus]GCE26844.1 hypothetical protein KDA_23280 [Dictyobacter alpinus]